MTTIASFQVEGQAVLFGDLLISGKNPSPTFSIPTIGLMDTLQTENSDLRPEALTQKIAIINPDLAVAWSGTQYLARGVIRRLREQFCLKSPTEAQLNQFLDELAPIYENEVAILGMLAVSPKRMWHFGYGVCEELTDQYGMFRTAGSGGYVLSDLLHCNAQVLKNGGLATPPYAKAASVALSMSASLQAYEIFTKGNLAELYGAGYEILTRLNDRWEKLNNLLTVYWIARESPGGYEVCSRPAKIIYQTYHNELLIIRSLTLDPSRPDSESSFIIDPASGPAHEWQRKQVVMPDFSGKWIVHQFTLQKTDGTAGYRTRITYEENPEKSSLRVNWDGKRCEVTTEPNYFDHIRGIC